MNENVCVCVQWTYAKQYLWCPIKMFYVEKVYRLVRQSTTMYWYLWQMTNHITGQNNIIYWLVSTSNRKTKSKFYEHFYGVANTTIFFYLKLAKVDYILFHFWWKIIWLLIIAHIHTQNIEYFKQTTNEKKNRMRKIVSMDQMENIKNFEEFSTQMQTQISIPDGMTFSVEKRKCYHQPFDCCCRIFAIEFIYDYRLFYPIHEKKTTQKPIEQIYTISMQSWANVLPYTHHFFYVRNRYHIEISQLFINLIFDSVTSVGRKTKWTGNEIHEQFSIPNGIEIIGLLWIGFSYLDDNFVRGRERKKQIGFKWN